jgi:hypothetical protein
MQAAQLLLLLLLHLPAAEQGCRQYQQYQGLP